MWWDDKDKLIHCYFSFKATGISHHGQALALGSYLESVQLISMGEMRKTLWALFTSLDLVGVLSALPGLGGIYDPPACVCVCYGNYHSPMHIKLQESFLSFLIVPQAAPREAGHSRGYFGDAETFIFVLISEES